MPNARRGIHHPTRSDTERDDHSHCYRCSSDAAYVTLSTTVSSFSHRERVQPMRRFVCFMCIALGAVVITACGDDGVTTPSGTGQFNAADVTFAQSMVPHHEQAVEMARLALDANAGASAKTKDIAARIKQAQDPEITMMRSMMQAWGTSEMSNDMAGHGMVGMMSSAEMAALAKLAGTQFDRSWAEMMIKHHQGAIEMANTVKKSGKSSEVRTLADQIIATQTAEINELQTLTK
jgi:uncharacterized protein (DUF305 family)